MQPGMTALMLSTTAEAGMATPMRKKRVTLGIPTCHSRDIGGGLDGQTVIQVAALEGIGVALHGADSSGLYAVHQAEGQEHRER